MYKFSFKQGLCAALVTTLLASGCASDGSGMTKTGQGAVIGALGGAVLGAAINHDNRGKGALIGAVGGGLIGTGVGAYMDKQAQDLQKVLAPEVQAGNIRIAKLPDNSIKIIMTAATAFNSNASEIKPGFFGSMDKIAKVMNTYGKTSITILGHTDSQGSDDLNQALSEKRATAVANYFRGRNVNSARLDAQGHGKRQPVASNATEAGRAENRRVELYVVPIVAG
ncbi:OmpA family protein [Chitinimonas arctica]|uniref:OmpA family protein n=1 Tax=Chitinimonas arctica TaxID=2594795 RepID=A0A516SDR5_9NEIS|nr:OmpA family protein [Chitinimonas arctica]QDQ26302.1 OmpA family protein [Chitinimonas arctica]